MSQPRTTSSASPGAGQRADESARRREAIDRFVEFWGEMATNWGINRTMAQIHAYLYCVEEPLDTDQIMERLQISRGNANMNLRSLTEWNLVRKTRRPDSRKDYYAAEKDVWHITAQIIQERERREIRPVRQELEACASLLGDGGDGEGAATDAGRQLRARIRNLIDLIEVFEGFSDALLPLVEKQEVATIRRLMAVAQALTARSSAGNATPDGGDPPAGPPP